MLGQSLFGQMKVHSLLLSSRQFRRQVVHALLKTDFLEKVFPPLHYLVVLQSPENSHGQLDILLDSEGRQKIEGLEDEPDVFKSHPGEFRILGVFGDLLSKQFCIKYYY
jgi:hypothetical protein